MAAQYPFTRDLYEILGISKNATQDEIKNAYRKVAMELHPDKNPDNPEVLEKFKEASAAYEILGDANNRKKYDLYRNDAFKKNGQQTSSRNDNSDYGPEEEWENWRNDDPFFDSSFEEQFGDGLKDFYEFHFKPNKYYTHEIHERSFIFCDEGEYKSFLKHIKDPDFVEILIKERDLDENYMWGPSAFERAKIYFEQFKLKKEGAKKNLSADKTHLLWHDGSVLVLDQSQQSQEKNQSVLTYVNLDKDLKLTVNLTLNTWDFENEISKRGGALAAQGSFINLTKNILYFKKERIGIKASYQLGPDNFEVEFFRNKDDLAEHLKQKEGSPKAPDFFIR